MSWRAFFWSLVLTIAGFVAFYFYTHPMRLPQPTWEPPKVEYRIQGIGDCEYIEVERGETSSRVYSLTHKGDCPNPIHCRREK
jgi:hypothetical protein